jgi:hypothetical protein
METIILEDNVKIYKTRVDLVELQEDTLENIILFLSSVSKTRQDNYTYIKEWSSLDFENEFKPRNKIEEIIKFGVNSCAQLYVENSIPFNKINVNSWVNVVRGGLPKQSSFKNEEVGLHTHTFLQKELELFYPNYTFVYYAQMPDNIVGDEGTLIIEGLNGKRHYYLPNVGDLIIMAGDIPHSPNRAPNSTKDRLVIAGNVGLENVKKKNTLI